MGCHGTATNRVTRGASDLPLGGMQAKVENLRIQNQCSSAGEQALRGTGKEAKMVILEKSSPELCSIPPSTLRLRCFFKRHLHGTRRVSL